MRKQFAGEVWQEGYHAHRAIDAEDYRKTSWRISRITRGSGGCKIIRTCIRSIGKCLMRRPRCGDVPGAKARFRGGGVRAKARTYLRSNGNGNGKGEGEGEGNAKDESKGEGFPHEMAD